MTIPATPFVERSENMKTSVQDRASKQVPRISRKDDVREKENRVERDENQSIRLDDDEIENLSSPVSITLGVEDHDRLSPLDETFENLFGSPVKAISPLHETPKKIKLQTETSSSFVVIEDETVTEPQPPKKIVYEPTKELSKVSRKRDSSHLALPRKDVVEEGKKWNRFLAPPSEFASGEKAEKVKEIRQKAREAQNYIGQVIPLGYAGVKKEEKAVLSDGTVYYLSAFWMANPTLVTNQSSETQTPLVMLPSRMQEAGTVTDIQCNTKKTVSTSTQTEEEKSDDIRVVTFAGRESDDFSFYFS